ncbi:MAG: hypothetical protein HY242_08535 [Afipia sp.]|nr:hypothetical protein [Afipia sp.]
MVRRTKHWSERSAKSKIAHVIERVGLALTGGACGLFVAAYLVKSNINLFGTDAFAFGMMALGAAGFYLGIDLPPHSQNQSATKVDTVELLSAAGTFLAALESVASVVAIITGDIFAPEAPIAVGIGWTAGAAMQIAAGVLARRG